MSSATATHSSQRSRIHSLRSTGMAERMSAVSDMSFEGATRCSPDAAALACSLFARHRGRIYGFCLCRLRSPHDAEDALQQTFVNALRALQAGVRPRMEAAWLLGIARNVCLERHRSGGRLAQRETTTDPGSLDQFAASDPSLENGAADLGAALDRLDRRQREALLLREWRGLSYKEIASVLQLSQSAVETLLFRARRSLARALEDGKRLRSGLNLGGVLANLRALLSGAAGKTAAIVAGCGVAAAAAPTLEHAITGRPDPRDTPGRTQGSPTPSTGTGEHSRGTQRHVSEPADRLPRLANAISSAMPRPTDTPTRTEGAGSSTAGTTGSSGSGPAGGGATAVGPGSVGPSTAGAAKTGTEPTLPASQPAFRLEVSSGGGQTTVEVAVDGGSTVVEGNASASISSSGAEATAGVDAPGETSVDASAGASGSEADGSASVSTSDGSGGSASISASGSGAIVSTDVPGVGAAGVTVP